jgi:hypothetical protein
MSEETIQPNSGDESTEASFLDGVSEDLRPDLEGYESADQLATDYLELKKQQPQIPETYETNISEELPEDLTEAVTNDLSGLGTLAREAGITQQQYSAIADYYQKIVKEQVDKVDALRAEAESQLKSEWGDSFEPNLHKAQKVLDKFGGKSLAESHDLGNSPEFTKFLVQVADAISEDTFERGGTGPGPSNKGADGQLVIKYDNM